MIPPPRLFVLTGIGSGTALVLRRGPTHRVAAIGWDRADHHVTEPNRLDARLYEHRADLSPDGRWWVYFAYAHGKARTVVARAPLMAATLVLPQSHTMGGGGSFDADGRLALNAAVPDPDPWPRDLPPRAPPGTFPASGSVQDCPDSDWADIFAGRLQFTARGCLWEASPEPDGTLADVICRHDFRDMPPETEGA